MRTGWPASSSLPASFGVSVMGSFIRWGAVGTVAERALHLHRIQPAPMLAAEASEDADQLEAEAFVQLDRCGIGGFADHRDHLPESACGAFVDQRLHQCTADAMALEASIDVDRVLHRPLIGDAAAIRVCVGVPGQL